MEDRLFRSEDGGETWAAVGGLPFADPSARLVSALLIDPVDSNRLVLGGDRVGLYISGNGGQEWSEVAEELRALKITSVASVGGDLDRFRAYDLCGHGARRLFAHLVG